MVVNSTSDEELVLDLASITVNGQRYTVDSEDQVVTGERKEGIGINKRTGKYVGGGAAIGAIIGAIAGGGKGAAIGAGVGAAGGAATQVLTRGDEVNVPSESLLTFRLQQPLRADYRNTSYGTTGQSAAYDAGFQAGRTDADRNLTPEPAVGPIRATGVIMKPATMLATIRCLTAAVPATAMPLSTSAGTTM
jgi:hypothetical protein